VTPLANDDPSDTLIVDDESMNLRVGEDVDTRKRWLRIAVEDTGRGIPADHVSFIFDPCRQVLSEHASISSGLGRAIVSLLIPAPKERITVQSRESVGSCFTVFLPVDS
jgi:signal transduction histidine kinase